MADKNILDEFKILSAKELEDPANLPEGFFEDPGASSKRIWEQNRRDTLKDSAVNIYDTLQSIGNIPLSVLPGVGLEDAAKISQELDAYRSPAYLREREKDALENARITAEQGELAGFRSAVSNTFEGGNLAADAAMQIPYALGIGPAARALGVTSKAAVPSVLSQSLTGTGQAALVNRVALLSGGLEGAGGYGQTYQRAIAEGATEEEALRQARIAGAASAAAGVVLGKLTPGFELDPFGRNGGPATQFVGQALLPTLTAIGAEAIEEGGMAITNTVVDNMLAGRNPTEGLGASVGEAVAISSAVTGGIRGPSAVLAASKAVGTGIAQGLRGIGNAAADRAVTPQDAAVDAALNEVSDTEQTLNDMETAWRSTSTASDTEESDAEKTLRTIQDALRNAITPEADSTSLNEGEEAPRSEATPPPTPPTPPTSEDPTVIKTVADTEVDVKTVQDSDVKTVLTSAAMDNVIDAETKDGEVSAQQAATIEAKNSLEKGGEVDQARANLLKKSEDELEQAAKDAPTDPEAAGLIEAVAATDITRLPKAAVADSLKPVVEKLASVVEGIKKRLAGANDGRTKKTKRTSEQLLEAGWNTTGKRNARKKGMQEHVQNVIYRLSKLREEQRNTGVKVEPATEAARFMKQVAARAAAFQEAKKILEITNQWLKNKDKYPQYQKYQDMLSEKGYFEVEGAETLNDDGTPSGKLFQIHPKRAGSVAMLDIVQEDFADAVALYDVLKSSYPKLMVAAEARADQNKAKQENRQALRERTQSKPKPAAEQKKAEPAKKADKPKKEAVTASTPVIARAVTRALAAKGLKPTLSGVKVEVDPKDLAAAEAELAAQEKLAADKKKEVKPAAQKKREVVDPDEGSDYTGDEDVDQAEREARGFEEQQKKTLKRISNSILAAKTIEQLDAAEADLNKDGAFLDDKDQAALKIALDRKRTRMAPKAPPTATAPATPAPAPEASPNTIVTDEAADKFRAILKGKSGQVNSGLDPEMVKASVGLAVYHIERGARTFAAYTQAMLADVGDVIRPYLKSAYKAARFDKRLSAAIRNEMTPISEVNKANIDPQPQTEELTSDDFEQEAEAEAARQAADELAREDVGEELTDLPDGRVDSNTAQESVALPQENPILKVTGWAKLAGKTLLDWFSVKKDVSYEGWVQKLKDAGLYELYANEERLLLDHFYGRGEEYEAKDGQIDVPVGVFQEGEGKLVGRGDKEKPFGAVSVFMTEDGSIPEEVARAFALAGAIVVLRNSAMYNTLENERGEPRRDAIPGVWAKDITKLAFKILGIRATRKFSLSIEQGAGLSLGLSTVEALVRSGNFVMEGDGRNIYANIPMATYLREDGNDNVTVYPSKVLIPNEAGHQAGITNLNEVDRTAELFENERLWEVSDAPPEDISTVDKVIQYGRKKLSEKIRQGLFKRENVGHGLNTQMNDVASVLGAENLAAVLMGHYGEIPDMKNGQYPYSVRQALRSMHTAYMNEFRAINKYLEVTQNGLKKLYYKYHLGQNNRAKTAMGPQNNKLLRDLFSSAQETLNLNDANHVRYLKLALAQAFGVKTDINDHDTVIRKWDTEVAAEHKELALKLQDAMALQDPLARQGAVLEALRRDKAWTPRQLNGLLTYGRMLKALEGKTSDDAPVPFENFLPFEIDGKTNGSFNTELFFGLGVRNGANLEQGGLFLSKIGATYETERERMQAEYHSDDFYGRVNKRAELGYAAGLIEALAKMREKNPNISPSWWWKTTTDGLRLLETAGLIEFDADPKKTFSITNENGVTIEIPELRQFVFKRDAGKIASIPVQYGGSAKGVKSQLWREMVRLLNHRWIEVNTELNRTPAGARRTELLQLKGRIEGALEGSDSFKKADKRGLPLKETNPAEKLWHHSTLRLSQALHDSYRSQKPRVAVMTDTLVALTNIAFVAKAAQWRLKANKMKLAHVENQDLIKKYGAKTWLFELSPQEIDELNDSTLDLSFSTLSGDRMIDLNSTEFDAEGPKVSGFGTGFETSLDLPTPRKIGVRILAMLTIGGGDAAMGTDFFQGDWNATDVFDGIELLVTDILRAGEALNQSVWRTGEFDILNDFLRMNRDVQEFLDSASEEEVKAILDVWHEVTPPKLDPNGERIMLTWPQLLARFEESKGGFEGLYADQRRGWETLVADGPHTMLQMGGGGSFTTPAPTRAAALELSLDDEVERQVVKDLSEAGTREAGLYPRQYKDPRATRIEDEEGLIDVIMTGARWVGKNTWNSAKAKFDEVTKLSAGTRRLIRVLRMAEKAGVAYDSDKSVHPSAVRMYLRAKADGVLTWESDYTTEELQAAVDSGELVQTDKTEAQDGKPVFRNVRLVGRAASFKGYNDTNMTLKTMFSVARMNTLGRESIIEALDKVQWKNPIQRAVWKRLRNLLSADLRVTYIPDAEAWDTWSNAVGSTYRYGSALGISNQQRIAVLYASPTLLLHELLHSVFTAHLNNFFNNINAVPVELRGPLNDLAQLATKFMKLSGNDNITFAQNVMLQLEFRGDQAGVVDEMLAYILSSEAIMEKLSPGFVRRAITRMKQIFSRILGIKTNVADSFYDEALDIFRGLTDSFAPPMDSYQGAPRAALSNTRLADLEQLTVQAYQALEERFKQGMEGNIKQVRREAPRALGMAKSAYNLSPEQEDMFSMVYMLMRAGSRSADVEEFITTTLAKHPQKNLFNNSPDMVAAAMALVAVEPTFANQLNALWAGRPTESRLNALIDKALDTRQSSTSQQILTEALSGMLMNKEVYNSFLGTSVSRLNRLGRRMLEKVGATAEDLAESLPEAAPDVADWALRGIAALTSEKGAKQYGQILQTAVNELPNQRWLKKLVADLQGTKGDGKLFHRAHNAMKNAIDRTRSQFDNTLPRELAKLFPDNFDGWNNLFEYFGALGVNTLGSAARDMYLKDAERQRMITVLESKVNNWIDAKNLGYYMVHGRVRPGSAQELLRNARAIADNVNGQRQVASEELVKDVDQLVTLYAIDFLEPSQRATIGKYFQAHPQAMDNLLGMLQSVKDAEESMHSKQYQYLYWKNTLPLSTDPRSSVVVANAVEGARLEQLGFTKGKRYDRTAGDPETLHYYTRKYSPPPVFTQGIIATVQQTGEGINYTSAATINPQVGTMITDRRTIDYIQRNRGLNSNFAPIYGFDGTLLGYERLLDPAIVREHLKGDNTLLHVAIGKRMGRIAEENIAKVVNDSVIQTMVNQWKDGKTAGREKEYEAVDSSTDKQVARAWEVIPADMKEALQAAFDGPVMIRSDLVEDTIGYHNMGVLEVFTGDASLDDKTRRAVIGLVQSTFMGPWNMQKFLAAERLLLEGVATAKDTIIVRSLSVPYNNFIASVHLVLANGVPITKVIKWYREGMKEIQAFNRLERERMALTIKIAGTTDPAEKARLEAVRNSKVAAIQRLNIYPLIAAGDLSDLPEGLEDTPSHTYLGDLAGWVNNHLREKVHPKAPAYLANAIFAKDSTLHDAMSKAIQAGDFLARYAIFKHMLETGHQQDDAIDTVRDELVSYQSNPGRMRAGLEAYGMVWWSQFTIRAQNVILNRFRKNPFSFMVSQGLGSVLGTPGPLDGALWERGLDNSVGVDNIFTAPSAYLYAKAF